MIERTCRINISESVGDFTVSANSSEDGTPPEFITILGDTDRLYSLYPSVTVLCLRPFEIPGFIAALSKVAAEGYEVWGR